MSVMLSPQFFGVASNTRWLDCARPYSRVRLRLSPLSSKKTRCSSCSSSPRRLKCQRRRRVESLSRSVAKIVFFPRQPETNERSLQGRDLELDPALGRVALGDLPQREIGHLPDDDEQ